MKNLGKAIVPIGTVVFYLGTTIPDGYLLCNGASLSRTEFPELFAVLGTKCGSVDSAHFTLPDTHHRFLEGTTTLSEVGQYIAAGLPNIKGSTGTIPYINTLEGTGAFETDIQGQVQATGATNTAYCYLNLNASAHNSIYSDSVTTVRPEAFRAYCLIRYS